MKRDSLFSRRPAVSVVLLPLALVLVQGCAGFTSYKGDTQVIGLKPPPPPPPPPAPPPPPEPPPAPKRVEVRGNKVEINETIQFENGKAIIKPESDSLIDEIAAAIKTLEGRKVRVEGHASSDGDKVQNQKLSEARAKSVAEALTKRGIPKEQPIPQGFGSQQPIADNNTEEGRVKNRRVEFVIYTKSGRPPKNDDAPKPDDGKAPKTGDATKTPAADATKTPAAGDKAPKKGDSK